MNEEKWLEENLKILRKYNGDGTYTVKECVLKEEYDKLFEENARLKDKIDKYIEIIENLYSEKEISKYQYEKYMSISKEN